MVELMVAITVLAIGILAIAGVVPMAVKSMTKSQVSTKGLEYAQQQMELLKRAGFSGLPAAGALGTVITSDPINPSGNLQYQTWWEITADVNGESNIRQVSVFGTWGPDFRDTVHLVNYFSR